MSKIENDKYYTPVDLAKYCIDKTFEIIGKENIKNNCNIFHYMLICI